MYKIDKEKAKHILTTELGYTPARAELYLKDYPLIHNELAEAAKSWMEDRSKLDVSVFGISIKEYMKIQHCHFLMAVRDLNHLLDKDIPPERRTRLVELLRKPTIEW